MSEASLLDYPFDAGALQRRKKSLRRDLLTSPGLTPKRIALLGGSTTNEIRDMLELFLLRQGIQPSFFESEYNQFAEDAVFGNAELDHFKPELILVFSSQVNVRSWPQPADDAPAVEAKLASELGRFRSIWDALKARHACPIIQNNFDAPPLRLFGSLDAVDLRGRLHFVRSLNQAFAAEARSRTDLWIFDLDNAAAWYGLERWHDRRLWFMAKYAMALEAIPFVAHGIASLIKAMLGRSKKVLVLDLDNTLWGGVIGDDGVAGIQLGKETAEAEAYTAFQEYAKLMASRGVVLAVASKNDQANAIEGIQHPDSVLKPQDFAAFKANWDPKPNNLAGIAAELSLGIDSLLFMDDNPAERAIVAEMLPGVGVPDIGSDPTLYPQYLDRGGWLETTALSADDLKRSEQYTGNAQRTVMQMSFENYEDYLSSLEMQAEIGPFKDIYLDRITQLSNKTNQFNLTTRRYTAPEIQAVASDGGRISLYGRLKDRFGDNGLVSVVIGRAEAKTLHLELWLMSCRVLKRDMEAAMLDRVVAMASARGLDHLVGYYIPSPKNGMVRDFYKAMGFALKDSAADGSSTWALPLAGYSTRNKHIEVIE